MFLFFLWGEEGGGGEALVLFWRGRGGGGGGLEGVWCHFWGFNRAGEGRVGVLGGVRGFEVYSATNGLLKSFQRLQKLGSGVRIYELRVAVSPIWVVL